MPFDTISAPSMNIIDGRIIDGGAYRVVLSARRDGETQTTVSLHGELGSRTTGDVLNELVRQIETGVSRLVVELEHLTWMSRSGLRALLVASKLLQAKGGRLVITGARQGIRQVMNGSGFNHLLRME